MKIQDYQTLRSAYTLVLDLEVEKRVLRRFEAERCGVGTLVWERGRFGIVGRFSPILGHFTHPAPLKTPVHPGTQAQTRPRPYALPRFRARAYARALNIYIL